MKGNIPIQKECIRVWDYEEFEVYLTRHLITEEKITQVPAASPTEGDLVLED